jgi:hypothetical protein
MPNMKSDAPTPMSDESSPADTATEPADYYDHDNDYDDTNTGEEDTGDSYEPQLPQMPHSMRSSSAEPPARGLARVRPAHFAGTRQVRSSPGHVAGSEVEPIEIDLTPNPLRRQLFPSPSKPQIRSDPTSITVMAQTSANLPSFVRRSPRLNRTKHVLNIAGVAGAVAVTVDGKENTLPGTLEDDLEALFNGGIDEEPLPPATPTPTRRSERLFMKTPQRTFGMELSPNAQRTPTYRTPKLKNGQHPVAAALLGSAMAKNDISDMTPFTRAIAETLNGTCELGFLTPPNQKGSKKSTPGKTITFDFPDLPSLNNSSPMNPEMFNLNFSELPTDILGTDINDPFSTDAPLPSSPPGFMTFINPDGHEEHAMNWETGNEEAGSVYPNPEMLSMPPPGQSLR